MRLFAGSKGIGPVARAKTPKVGAPFARLLAVTLGDGVAMQLPNCLVAHRVRLIRSVSSPVFAMAVIVVLSPTLTVATAKAFAAALPGMCSMPSFDIVAANATMSGTGLVEADSRR